MNKDFRYGVACGTSLGLIAGVVLTGWLHTAPAAPPPPAPDPVGAAVGAAAGALVQSLLR